jgi:hypothetical protein
MAYPSPSLPLTSPDEEPRQPPHKRARSDVESPSHGHANLQNGSNLVKSDEPAAGGPEAPRLYSCGKCLKSYANLSFIDQKRH